jgi:hypothetical protein
MPLDEWNQQSDSGAAHAEVPFLMAAAVTAPAPVRSAADEDVAANGFS